jgi:hypothetical protein
MQSYYAMSAPQLRPAPFLRSKEAYITERDKQRIVRADSSSRGPIRGFFCEFTLVQRFDEWFARTMHGHAYDRSGLLVSWMTPHPSGDPCKVILKRAVVRQDGLVLGTPSEQEEMAWRPPTYRASVDATTGHLVGVSVDGYTF